MGDPQASAPVSCENDRFKFSTSDVIMFTLLNVCAVASQYAIGVKYVVNTGPDETNGIDIQKFADAGQANDIEAINTIIPYTSTLFISFLLYY
ncbi:hypothetical protein CUJ83_00080 [Methanocella sp. CWC-04]|uniref:Uncharacterized protein n=1 Tax=Methanooceanicella nereidis TaxID=2052831 RepID=A0AAP2RC98_9EURY|nr:hypothetical protein [Methanocella sp. CWC-04]MCD1293395.1 hypothetical protein [Methanocella sp. CWC-04]